MKNYKIGGCIAVFLAGIALIVLLIAVYAFFGGQKILEQKRVKQGPPSILVHSPSDGETIPAGTITTASAVASSTNPILRVELWFDGELYDTQRPDADQLNDATTLHALFDLPVIAGPHMLSWRAMDNTGLVGQSLPITIFGSPSAGDPGVTTERVIGDGVTVVDIAADHNVDTKAIRKLNPGLGGGTIPPGTKVNVPDPNNGGGGQPPPLQILSQTRCRMSHRMSPCCRSQGRLSISRAFSLQFLAFSLGHPALCWQASKTALCVYGGMIMPITNLISMYGCKLSVDLPGSLPP